MESENKAKPGLFEEAVDLLKHKIDYYILIGTKVNEKTGDIYEYIIRSTMPPDMGTHMLDVAKMYCMHQFFEEAKNVTEEEDLS